MKMSRVLLAGAALTCFTFPAAAQDTAGVFAPVVTEGHQSVNYRIAIDPEGGPGGDTGWAQRLHYQRAIDSRFMWRIVGQTRKTADSDLDFDYLQGELFIDMTEDDSAAWQTGFRIDVTVRDDDRPGGLGVHWTNQWNLGEGWRARGLVMTGVQAGDNAADGVFLQTRAQLFKTLENGHGVGVEMYNRYGSTESLGNFNSQNHKIGPIYNLPLGDGFSIYGGPLFGISDNSPDNEFRLWLTKSL